MAKNHINLGDFDLDLFLIGRKLIIKSEGLEALERVCDQLSRRRASAFLIAPPGTGVENFLDRYKTDAPERVFVVDCFRSPNILAELMIQIGFGHRTINWFNTPVQNIVEGLTYFLGKMNNRTLFVFNHCDSLKLPQLADLLHQATIFSGLAAVIFRVTLPYAEKIEKCSDPKLRHHAASLGKLMIDYPTTENLMEACHKNGIVSATVVSNIVKDTLDFDVVASRVEMLRAEVKSSI